jgi:hypothetical protein
VKDYRHPQNRREYFDALYRMNLSYGVMPGLVYLYMPALAEHNRWDAEQRLWFAVINGCTQNPITSLIIFNRQPEPPATPDKWRSFDEWFNAEWNNLQFDTDRRHQKADTVKALHSYWKMAREAGSQAALWSGADFATYWERADGIYSFGRLSKFSYLEYVKIMGFGADCDRMFFEDKSGSKSHRNGMFFLLGMDDKVWDKRTELFGMTGHDGNYTDFKKMCSWLEGKAGEYLTELPGAHADAGRFTLESNLCTFKNHFFARRYPGVYADMAWDRIEWYDAREQSAHTEIFKAIREKLPEWLRIETEKRPRAAATERKAQFMKTGFPHRGEYFLEN